MKILACVDLSVGDEAILEVLSAWGNSVLTQVWLLHVAASEPEFAGYDEPGGPYDREQRAAELWEERAQMDRLLTRLEGRGVDAIRILRRGAVVDTVEQEALLHEADAILVSGGHRSRIGRILTGSVVGGLLQRHGVPVIVARGGGKVHLPRQ